MKNKLVFLLVIVLVLSFGVNAQTQKELNEKIKDASDPEIKFDLLEKFKEKYSNEKNLESLLLQLSAISYQLKKYEKTIEFSEKAVNELKLDDKKKIQVYLWLANSFYVTKSNNEKVIEYADLCVKLGKQLKGDKEVSQYTKKYIVPALRIQSKVYALDNDPDKVVLSVPVALEAYGFDKSRNNEKLILSISIKLYKAGKVKEAIQCVESIYNVEKPKRKYIDKLAMYYNKLGNKAKTIEYYKKSYEIRPSAKTAGRLGILYIKNVDQAIKYFADAYVLSGMKKSSRYYKYLRQKVYNEKMKGKAEEDQDAYFAEVVGKARANTGK